MMQITQDYGTLDHSETPHPPSVPLTSVRLYYIITYTLYETLIEGPQMGSLPVIRPVSFIQPILCYKGHITHGELCYKLTYAALPPWSDTSICQGFILSTCIAKTLHLSATNHGVTHPVYQEHILSIAKPLHLSATSRGVTHPVHPF